MNGQQEGDPAKLAQALLTITSLDQPPQRFIALGRVSLRSAVWSAMVV
jgi:hypothetical protein